MHNKNNNVVEALFVGFSNSIIEFENPNSIIEFDLIFEFRNSRANSINETPGYDASGPILFRPF